MVGLCAGVCMMDNDRFNNKKVFKSFVPGRYEAEVNNTIRREIK